LSPNNLIKTEFSTAGGPIWLWHGPEGLTSDKPVLLTITGAFAGENAMSKMQAVVGSDCDAVLMNLPGNLCPPLAEATPEAFARALDEVIPRAFGTRPLVLHGLSVGALVALGVTAGSVRRIVAVDPTLTTANLWPMIPRLRQMLRERPGDAAMRAFIEGVFGVTDDAVVDRGRHYLFERLRAPVDVLVGETPLMPERPLDKLPSLVGEPERAFMRDRPGVTLTVAPAAGHHVPYQAPLVLKDVLVRALRIASGLPDLTPLQEALLARTPAAARRLAYVGAAVETFQACCRVRNPHVAFEGDAPLEALALDDLAHLASARDLAAKLGPDGALVAAIPAGAPERLGPLLQILDQTGLDLLQLQPAAVATEYFDDRASDLAPAWRAGALAAQSASDALVVTARPRRADARPPLHICSVTFAPRLMDIRTRLPSHGLRTEPVLSVTYQKTPFNLPAARPDEPKVQILQRPALLDPVVWRNGMDASIRGGWIVVMEYDDHPELVAEVKGRALSDADWLRFGYVHAVQTSTQTLADAFRRYNPETRIFRNSAFELEPFPEAPPRRVFYGAVQRGGFAQEIARSLAPATAEFPDVEFVVIGDRAVFDALPTLSKRFYEYMPYDDYLRMMATCSISLSPIEGRRHQDTKSDTKFLDAASRGVLTIASPTIYAEVIRHGENGLIAHATADWAPLLAGALRDEAARRHMAEAAWRYVRDQRMFADQIHERRDWYRDLWDRRAELNAAVAARLPGLAEGLAAG